MQATYARERGSERLSTPTSQKGFENRNLEIISRTKCNGLVGPHTHYLTVYLSVKAFYYSRQHSAHKHSNERKNSFFHRHGICFIPLFFEKNYRSAERKTTWGTIGMLLVFFSFLSFFPPAQSLTHTHITSHHHLTDQPTLYISNRYGPYILSTAQIQISKKKDFQLRIYPIATSNDNWTGGGMDGNRKKRFYSKPPPHGEGRGKFGNTRDLNSAQLIYYCMAEPPLPQTNQNLQVGSLRYIYIYYFMIHSTQNSAWIFSAGQ